MAIYSGVFPLKMVIFHSYVSLPEGILIHFAAFHLLHLFFCSLMSLECGTN